MDRKWEQPSAYSDTSRPEGTFVTESVDADTIRDEKDRLIAAAKAQGFFWDDDAVARIADMACAVVQGGMEHDAYLVGSGDQRVVIRNTANGIYGLPDKSPAQYLQRLSEYNRTFPALQIRLIGVSEDADGNAVIWTTQPFAPGKEFKNFVELQAALKAAGWKSEKGLGRYVHEATGTVIRDVHPGNVLHRDGELFPIDVQVEKLPRQGTGG